MARKNYYKSLAKKNASGLEMIERRSSKKEISRPEHRPKGLRKQIKKETMTRKKNK
jgi:uncharacterized protein YdbL (DUF1318 family)